MLFLNVRKILVLFLFFVGAGTLFLGYSGLVGNYLNESVDSKKLIEKPGPSPTTNQAAMSDSGLQETKAFVTPTPQTDNESYFVEYRLQRQRSRSQQTEMLKEILSTPSADGNTKQVAQEQLLGISKSVAQESRLENLLKAYGYKDVVVCIDPKGVTVVLDGNPSVTEEQLTLMQMISRETGFEGPEIVISTKK